MKIPLLQNWEEATQFLNNFLGFQLQAEQIEQLLSFYKILFENNQIMNLTKLSALPDFLTFHLADTATVLHTLQKNNISNLSTYLDLGSGCGVPGIIFHILAGQTSNLVSTLCDSRVKRTDYLQKTVETMKLNDKIKIVRARAEQMSESKTYRKAFDLVTARAFAKPLETLSAALPFLSNNGFFAYQTSVSLQNDSSYGKIIERYQVQILDEQFYEIADKPRYVGLLTKLK